MRFPSFACLLSMVAMPMLVNSAPLSGGYDLEARQSNTSSFLTAPAILKNLAAAVQPHTDALNALGSSATVAKAEPHLLAIQQATSNSVTQLSALYGRPINDILGIPGSDAGDGVTDLGMLLFDVVASILGGVTSLVPGLNILDLGGIVPGLGGLLYQVLVIVFQLVDGLLDPLQLSSATAGIKADAAKLGYQNIVSFLSG